MSRDKKIDFEAEKHQIVERMRAKIARRFQ